MENQIQGCQVRACANYHRQGPHIIQRNRPKFITKCLSIYEITLYLNCG